MNREVFQLCIGLLQAAYPNYIQEKTKTVTLDVYWTFLSAIPDDLFQYGVDRHIRTVDHFPTISELFRACSTSNMEAEAFQAWGEIVPQISNVGCYGSPKFSHPLTKKAIDQIGGWQMLCQCSTADLGRHRAAFIRAFEAAYNWETIRKGMGEGHGALKSVDLLTAERG